MAAHGRDLGIKPQPSKEVPRDEEKDFALFLEMFFRLDS
jgi:hypothetical protein